MKPVYVEYDPGRCWKWSVRVAYTGHVVRRCRTYPQAVAFAKRRNGVTPGAMSEALRRAERCITP